MTFSFTFWGIVASEVSLCAFPLASLMCNPCFEIVICTPMKIMLSLINVRCAFIFKNIALRLTLGPCTCSSNYNKKRYVYKLQSGTFLAAHLNVNMVAESTMFRYYLHGVTNVLRPIFKCKITVILRHFITTRSMWLQSILVKSITWIIYTAWRL